MTRLHLIQIAAAVVIAGAITAGAAYLAGPRSKAASCDPTRDIFYATRHYAEKPDDERITFVRFDPNAGHGDVEIATLRGYRLLTNHLDRKGRVFLSGAHGFGTALHSFMVCTGRLAKLLELPEASRTVMSAAFVGEGETVLITTTEGRFETSAHQSRVELFEKGRLIHSAHVSDESPLYADVVLAGVKPDGSAARLIEMGGDNGEQWGNYYRWDRKTNSVQNLGSIDSALPEESGFPVGTPSPSGRFTVRVQAGSYADGDLTPSGSATASRARQ